MKRKEIRDRINKQWLFWDGGIGTLLQAKGLEAGEFPERWNLNRPDVVKDIHKSYLLAGSNIVNTNTFGASRSKFPDDLEEIVGAAVDLAVQARDEVASETGRDDVYVSLGLGPTGRLLKPLGDLGFEEAVEIFADTVRCGADRGADLILIETMSDTYELKAAILAAKENSDLPVCATVTFDAGGKLLTGGDVKTCVALMEGLGVDALGVNCSLGPKEIKPIVQELVEAASIPVIATPNAGMPREENGCAVYDIGPEEFSDLMVDIAEAGVQIMGGCCGTTPDHIRLMVEKCRSVAFVPAKPKDATYVTSYGRAVRIGQIPKIIGERINPTGKKKFKEALIKKDISYILGEGLKQEDSGAHILDVNVGLPEIDEVEMMGRVITELQGVTALPLQIDTADPAVLERGLRLYNGKAMVNSVNGKQESMDAVFPLVAKYGGVVVALTLDEDGIPETADDRIAIAMRIVEEAKKYGIEKKDILIDGLTLAISSGTDAGRVTLATVEKTRSELGMNTILGVSNVSFGLPAREIVNASFLSMAIRSGLSCAIINPGNEAIMNAFRSTMALLGHDENCSEFIEAYKDYTPAASANKGAAAKTAETGAAAADQTAGNAGAGAAGKTSGNAGAAAAGAGLREYIERGLAEKAREAATDQLRSRDPLDIINEDLIVALDSVGKGFEAGSVFLPQLLMSAEATKAAFSVIKEAMPERKDGGRGRVIVATVKGDIHDIGKNIVKVLLENYGFDVIDLGRDVPPETIAEEAKEGGIKMVGLSALMTTTVASMKETVDLLRKESPETKVLVSGAVLNQEYADMMGADKYVPDAMGTVRYAEEILA